MRAVLDTNVLVSVLVYADPRFECVRTAWESGRLRVLSSIECLAELRRVLDYPQFSPRIEDADALVASYLRCAEVVDAQTPDKSLPICRDPDDQKFLQLAACGSADVLVTADKLLLALRRKVRFRIEAPEAFVRALRTV